MPLKEKKKTWYVRFETIPDNPDSFAVKGSKAICLKYLENRKLMRFYKNGIKFGEEGIPRMGYFI